MCIDITGRDMALVYISLHTGRVLGHIGHASDITGHQGQCLSCQKVKPLLLCTEMFGFNWIIAQIYVNFARKFLYDGQYYGRIFI